jgi:hypothetical protein
LFCPNLGKTDVLDGGQFFAAQRLLNHVLGGASVDRNLVFVQCMFFSYFYEMDSYLIQNLIGSITDSSISTYITLKGHSEAYPGTTATTSSTDTSSDVHTHSRTPFS